MSDPNKNGGPAFPTADTHHNPGVQIQYGEDGMSLRDYFAAKALQNGFRSMFIEEDQTYAQIACHCYEMADAMLKERSIGK